jgi:CMP-N,N'-diacetyllegionaminic acid synthase
MIGEFFISNRSTLRDALISMTTHRRGLLFIIDSEKRLVGVLTDGDIRRALLQNAHLDSPIEQWMNLNPAKAETQDDALALITERPYLLSIPVVNIDGFIKGLYFTGTNGNVTYLLIDDTGNHEVKHVQNIAIIPARGGSKRIYKKNLSRIGKHSLLGWAIICAKSTSAIDKIIISTDDPEIKAEALLYDIEVEHFRPPHLSSDSAKTIDVLKYELVEFSKKYHVECQNCLLIEPTAPLRTPDILATAIDLFNQHDTDSLVSVTQLRHNFHPNEILRISDDKYLQPYLPGFSMDSRPSRKEQEPLYVQNGLVYITKCSVILEQGSLYGNKVLAFNTGEDSYLDIDNIDDLEIAKFKLSNK